MSQNITCRISPKDLFIDELSEEWDKDKIFILKDRQYSSLSFPGQMCAFILYGFSLYCTFISIVDHLSEKGPEKISALAEFRYCDFMPFQQTHLPFGKIENLQETSKD